MLVRQKKYAIIEDSIKLNNIQKILNEVRYIDEPSIPFPQANSFERVINLCELLNENECWSKNLITENYVFDERQTNYYTDTARYLGLVKKEKRSEGIFYRLTRRGEELFKLSLFDRQLEFVKLILSHLVFKKILELYFEKYEKPSKDEIVNIMKGANLYKVASENTFERRASTIIGWINWILDLIEE